MRLLVFPVFFDHLLALLGRGSMLPARAPDKRRARPPCGERALVHGDSRLAIAAAPAGQLRHQPGHTERQPQIGLACVATAVAAAA